jgi:hypothetical protein
MDTNVFFPERGVLVAPAKRICAGCEVRDECLEYAVREGPMPGIYGGASEEERRMMRSRVPLGVRREQMHRARLAFGQRMREDRDRARFGEADRSRKADYRRRKAEG